MVGPSKTPKVASGALLLLVLAAGCHTGASYYREGITLLEERRYEMAAQSFAQALDRLDEPRPRALALMNLAEAQFRMGDYVRSIGNYSRAANLFPENSWTFTGRGLVYDRLGLAEEALRDLEAAERMDAIRGDLGIPPGEGSGLARSLIESRAEALARLRGGPSVRGEPVEPRTEAPIRLLSGGPPAAELVIPSGGPPIPAPEPVRPPPPPPVPGASPGPAVEAPASPEVPSGSPPPAELPAAAPPVVPPVAASQPPTAAPSPTAAPPPPSPAPAHPAEQAPPEAVVEPPFQPPEAPAVVPPAPAPVEEAPAHAAPAEPQAPTLEGTWAGARGVRLQIGASDGHLFGQLVSAEQRYAYFILFTEEAEDGSLLGSATEMRRGAADRPPIPARLRLVAPGEAELTLGDEPTCWLVRTAGPGR